MQFNSSAINTVDMLTRDTLLCHFRKRLYHGGIGGCALLSLMYSWLYIYGNATDIIQLMKIYESKQLVIVFAIECTPAANCSSNFLSNQ